MRKWFSNASLAALAVSQIACLPSAPQVNVFRVGDRVQVGPLFFNVLDSKWRAQIGEGAVARVPEHRFLIVRLAVTNSGAQEITLPNLTVEILRMPQNGGAGFQETSAVHRTHRRVAHAPRNAVPRTKVSANRFGRLPR